MSPVGDGFALKRTEDKTTACFKKSKILSISNYHKKLPGATRAESSPRFGMALLFVRAFGFEFFFNLFSLLAEDNDADD